MLNAVPGAPAVAGHAGTEPNFTEAGYNYYVGETSLAGVVTYTGSAQVTSAVDGAGDPVFPGNMDTSNGNRRRNAALSWAACMSTAATQLSGHGCICIWMCFIIELVPDLVAGAMYLKPSARAQACWAAKNIRALAGIGGAGDITAPRDLVKVGMFVANEHHRLFGLGRGLVQFTKLEPSFVASGQLIGAPPGNVPDYPAHNHTCTIHRPRLGAPHDPEELARRIESHLHALGCEGKDGNNQETLRLWLQMNAVTVSLINQRLQYMGKGAVGAAGILLQRDWCWRMQIHTNFLFLSVARVGPHQDAVLIPNPANAIGPAGGVDRVQHCDQWILVAPAHFGGLACKNHYYAQFSLQAQWNNFLGGGWGHLYRCGTVVVATAQLWVW
jgi:hypothetical protein